MSWRTCKFGGAVYGITVAINTGVCGAGSMAWAACAAEKQEEAIRLGQEAYAIGDPPLIGAKYWPDFEELRQDARFDEILIKRGWK